MINENKLHRIITEAINNVLNENDIHADIVPQEKAEENGFESSYKTEDELELWSKYVSYEEAKMLLKNLGIARFATLHKKPNNMLMVSIKVQPTTVADNNDNDYEKLYASNDSYFERSKENKSKWRTTPRKMK